MKYGNWEITETGINWIGKPNLIYEIPRDELTDLGRGERANRYDWLMHIAEKTWVKAEDVEMLYRVFVDAATKYNMPYDLDILLDTITDLKKVKARKTEDREEEFNF